MNLKMKPVVDDLKPYEPGKPIEAVKEELGLDSVIKLASNENPHGSSQAVQKQLQEAGAPNLYPDGHAQALRQAVADHLQVKEGQLLFGAGSDEVILLLCRAMLAEQTNTVMATPTFSQYKQNAAVEGAQIIEVPLKDGVHDLDAMVDAIDDETRIVWICNPNNPSGTYVNAETFSAFMERVPSDVLVVSDEAYGEYVEAGDYPDTIAMMNTYENLLILRTFSKMYGLAGLRIGFAVGAEALISKLEPLRPPFNTTTVAQEAAIAALDDQAFVQDCREKNLREKYKLETFFKEKGCMPYPSETNFLLVNVGVNGDRAFDALLQRGIIVRSGEALGFANCIRVSIGTEKENEQFMASFSEWINAQDG
ncbi:histidinol-phosphate transaminase [Salicibibacter cibarius]|uniref:Histidinol-phosphate aminotransferase n=1 Tax=Salicibibacter cibarius TaxID=2743000 RepID=A0A7T7CBN7_9BACI|nr:histidinol-phosphate transaminase [Salicibibacter cibarius]QQK76024.1 histidinol-phosphate transaminase [Salicibibacter cibarius]